MSPSATESARILTLAGSFRSGSLNQALLAAAREVASSTVTFADFDLREIPFYDGDVEEAGDPQEVTAFKQAVAGADGLLVATPEYNGSLPAVLKNAIDWASRNHPNSVLRDKPVATMGATPGRSGARHAQEHLRDVLERVGAIVVDHPDLQLERAFEHIVDDRVITEEFRDRIGEVVKSLVDAVDLEARCRSRAALVGAQR